MYRLALTAASRAVRRAVPLLLVATAARAQTMTAPGSGNFGARATAHYTDVGGSYLPGASATQDVPDGVATASASMRNGTLRASARSALTPPRLTGNWGVTASAQYWTKVQVFPGILSDPNEPTYIDWKFTIDGSMGPGRFGGSRGGQLQYYFGIDEERFDRGGNYMRLTNSDTVRLSGRLELGASPVTLFYYGYLNVWAYGSAYADFGNTMRFEWSIPEGATYTDASGQFVAPTIQAAALATPEPASLTLFAAGAGALGVAVRRRTRAAPAAA